MTTRQKQVFELLTKGMDYKMIANELGITPKYVGVHVDNVKKKYGYETTVQAAVSLARQKLI